MGGLVAGAVIAVVVGVVGGFLTGLLADRRAARGAARALMVDLDRALDRPGQVSMAATGASYSLSPDVWNAQGAAFLASAPAWAVDAMSDLWAREAGRGDVTQPAIARARLAAERVARWWPGRRPPEWAEDLPTMP
jgi:hypothetical protein